MDLTFICSDFTEQIKLVPYFVIVIVCVHSKETLGNFFNG